MEENKQSTPEEEVKEEPFPGSTPDLNLNLLDGSAHPAYQSFSKDDQGDF